MKLLTLNLLDFNQGKINGNNQDFFFRLCSEFLRLQSAKSVGCNWKKMLVVPEDFLQLKSSGLDVSNLASEWLKDMQKI